MGLAVEHGDAVDQRFFELASGHLLQTALQALHFLAESPHLGFKAGQLLG